jgi:hydrogenase maturation protease
MLAIDSIEPMTLVELDEASHILVLDSIDVGRTPGTIVWFDADDLSPCASRSVFRFGVADLLMLAGQTGNAPEEAGILGVQPACTQAGVPMCPQVRAALPRLVGRATRIVERWLDDAPATFDRASARDPCRDGVGFPL